MRALRGHRTAGVYARGRALTPALSHEWERELRHWKTIVRPHAPNPGWRRVESFDASQAAAERGSLPASRLSAAPSRTRIR